MPQLGRLPPRDQPACLPPPHRPSSPHCPAQDAIIQAAAAAVARGAESSWGREGDSGLLLDSSGSGHPKVLLFLGTLVLKCESLHPVVFG